MKNRRLFINRWLIPVALCLLSHNLYAETFEDCAFDITFPAAPEAVETCNGDTCFTKYTYTTMTDMHGSLSVSAWCVPIDKDTDDTYTEDVMKQTLLVGAREKNVDPFETRFNAYDTHKVANIIGQGQSGAVPTLYIAQLRIGGDTAMVVEAETIGATNAVLDEVLSEVLKSIAVKQPAAPVQP